MCKGLLVDIETGEAALPRSPVDYSELGKVAARELFETSYASLVMQRFWCFITPFWMVWSSIAAE